jgi:hypothetical protein
MRHLATPGHGWRIPFVVGNLLRLAYGTGAAFAPSAMCAKRLAPQIHDLPDSRMNLRGFGGALSAIALYSLTSLGSPERARSLLWLNAATDAYDVAVTTLELRARGRLDRTIGGSFALNLTALGWWTLALLAIRRR